MLLPKLLIKYPLLSILLCVSTVSGDIQENLISLRDYEFVGEDKRLALMLAQRMAGLGSGKLTFDDLAEQESRSHAAIPSAPAPYPAIKVEHDQIQVNLKTQPRVNVSLDYAEFFNVSGDIDADGTWLAQLSGLNPARETGNLTAGSRRATYHFDPVTVLINSKVMDIMQQNIYNIQNRLAEVEPTIHKYQSDERFRIAFIFNRLEEWKKDIRTIYYAMKRTRARRDRMRFKRQLWYYEHLLRKNIDITYSIEFLIHLHSQYTKKMNEIIPRREREAMLTKKQAIRNKTAAAAAKKKAKATPKL